MNEVIKRYTPRPVMVIVDVRPDAERGEAGIPTDAYFAIEEIKDDGTATQQTFVHVPSAIEAEEAEEIGVEHLLRDIKTLSVGTLSSRVSDQLGSLRGLETRLREIRDYLDQVVQGTLPANQQIMANLQDVFNLLPALSSLETEAGKRPFTVATNDQLLVMYLSSLIRTVIALHELVLNKKNASEAATEQPSSGDKPAETAKEGTDKSAAAASKEDDAEDKEKKQNEKRGA